MAVLDTDVYSHLYLKKQNRSPEVPRWRALLTGYSIVVPTQVRAEVLAGIASSSWGERRRDEATEILNQTATVPVTEDVVACYATLFADCRHGGHALSDKMHTGDRWIAATAIALGAPLLACDQIYRNAPRLTLL